MVTNIRFSIARRPRALLFVLGLMTASAAMQVSYAQAPAAGPDTIVFTNGDKLTGKLEKSVGGSITFNSDAVGEITVPMAKIQELKSASQFVVLKKDEKITRKPKPSAPLEIANDTVTQTGLIEKLPEASVAYIVDEATYNKELNGNPGPFKGWGGSVTGGITILQSTSYGQTYTAGVSLARVIPSVAYLPLRTRTTFNLLETYGKLTQPVIPQTTPASPDAVAKTNIFHTDFEHDKYFSPRLYGLGGLSYDHNYSQGMDLQQIYGGGVGYTILLDSVQQLDAKADVHYERQHYSATSGTADNNLIGSTFGEAYKRTLPGKIQFTQSATYIRSWNNADAWSAIGAFGIALPVYHRFALSTNFLDNYLNNPATGYNKNSLQFITGITYTLK